MRDLDDIDWARLEHNYGTAEDIPGLLRACADGDLEAVGTLDNLLYHQGGWVCSAATAALPFLVRLAVDPAVEHRASDRHPASDRHRASDQHRDADRNRPAVIEIISSLTEASILAQEKFVDGGWPAALAAEMPRLLELLADHDPAVRRAGARLAGYLPVEIATKALLSRWPQEDDRVTRWDLVLALGALAARAPVPAEVTGLLRDLLHSEDEQLALAAVHALHSADHADHADHTDHADHSDGTDHTDPIDVRQHLDLMLRAVTGDVTGWEESEFVGGGRSVVVAWTEKLLRHDPPTAVAYALGVGEDTSDPERRVAMVASAGELIQEWHRPPSLTARLATWLEDPVPEVRYQAAFLFGGLGATAAAPYADALARVAQDTALRDSRGGTTVGHAGLWALTRLKDPRCVPLLQQELRVSSLGEQSGHFARDMHHPCLPVAHEQLAPLAEFADAFLPELRTKLEQVARHPTGPNAWPWSDVVSAWGDRAAGLVPELVVLLEHEATWWPAARALAAIGPTASAATDGLRRRAEDSLAAGWAYWRITGDAGPALAAAERELVPGAQDVVLRHAADLGPLLASHIDVVRTQARTPGWAGTRMEAARACWLIGGDLETAMPVLMDVAEPLLEGVFWPGQPTALRYLAALGADAAAAAPLARAVLDSPRRFASSGGWRVFVQDEDVRAAAAELLSGLTAVPG